MASAVLVTAARGFPREDRLKMQGQVLERRHGRNAMRASEFLLLLENGTPETKDILL